MNKTTDELLKTLKHNNLKTYLSDNKDEFVASSLSEALTQMLLLKNLSKAEVIEKANIFNVYGYQIFSGQKTPSRDKLISLFFGMSLSFSEAQTLLKHAGYAPLYPRNKRDSVIIYALENKMDLISCNIKLDSLGLSPL